jgi:hypothetical protein
MITEGKEESMKTPIFLVWVTMNMGFKRKIGTILNMLMRM